MPRGQPDFGVYASTGTIGAVSDLAELAVRLGSINIFDRRGKVIDYDDFEDVRKGWELELIGGATAVRASTAPKSGSQHWVLTTGAGAGTYARLRRSFPRFASKRLGIECCFAAPDVLTYFEIGLTQHDGARMKVGTIRVDINANTLSYITGAPVYTVFATVDPFLILNEVYYPIKVVVDFSTNKYVRCVFAGTDYDLSAFDLYDIGSPTNPITQVSMLLNWRAGAGGSTFIDDYILTMEEP